MSYKSRMCYIVVRSSQGPDELRQEVTPVAVFYDEETASGNAEGYNLEFEERGIEGIKFYVAVTCAYE